MSVVLCAPPAPSQQQNLERLLNQVDASFTSPAAPGTAPVGGQPGSNAFNTTPANYPMPSAPNGQSYAPWTAGQQLPQPQFGLPSNPQPAQPIFANPTSAMPAQSANLLGSFFGAPSQQRQPAPNPFSLSGLLHTFLSGSPSTGASNAAPNSGAALGSAMSDLARARDEAAQAEAAAERARYGERDMRSSAAESAQNHANAARAAADEAAQAACGHSQDANDAAAQARAAADRAQAAADRASYNASLSD